MANTDSTGLTEVAEVETETRAILQRMLARRSTAPRHLVAPGPSEDEIRQLARAASRAPDHMRLKPFRIIISPPDRRDALADAFEAAERELEPEIEGERLSAPARRLSTRPSCWP